MKRFALLSLTLALCACHSNVRNSSTVAVNAQHAKVVMKPSRGNDPVEFSIRREGDPDPRMQIIGTAMHVSDGRVGKFLSSVTQAVSNVSPQLEIQADPGKPLTVGSTRYDARPESYYICGMLKSTFTPERGKVYLVEVQYLPAQCEQQVYDVTDPAQRVAVKGAGSEAQADVSGRVSALTR